MHILLQIINVKNRANFLLYKITNKKIRKQERKKERKEGRKKERKSKRIE